MDNNITKSPSAIFIPSSIDISVTNMNIQDISERTLQASLASSNANVEVAKATYQEPTRFKERTKIVIALIIILAILLIMGMAIWKCDSSQIPEICIAGIITLGGAWSLFSAVQALKKN